TYAAHPNERGYPLHARSRNAHRRQRLPVCNNINPRATGGSPPLVPGVFHARAPLVHSGRGKTLARGGAGDGLGTTVAGSVAGAAGWPIREPSRVRPLSTPAVDPLPSPASGPPRLAPPVGSPVSPARRRGGARRTRSGRLSRPGPRH